VLLDGYTVLEAAGVVFKSATEPFDTSTPMGKFLFQLLGSMAELDRATLLDQMSMGRDRVARAGKWTDGPIPRGYTVDTAGCLVPSERWVEQVGMTEADLMRDLYHRVAQGGSGIAEAARLQALGVPLTRYDSNGTVHTSPTNKWHSGRILKMLQSTTYVGVHRVKSRFGTIERPVPPLVSQALWDAANAQIKRNQAGPKPNATRLYLLRGLIRCGLCDKSYVGQRAGSGTRRAEQCHYYRCGGALASGTPDKASRCKGKAINAHALETRLWQRCRYFVLNPDEVVTALARQRAQMPEPEDTSAREQALSRQLAEKQQEEALAFTAFRRGIVKLAAFEAEMDTIDQERSIIERELAALRAVQKRQAARLDYFERSDALLTRWRSELACIEAKDDHEAMQRLVHDLVASVTVHPDGVHVVYRFEAAEDHAMEGGQEDVALLHSARSSAARQSQSSPVRRQSGPQWPG
jgi:site-specific DNA recombinase